MEEGEWVYNLNGQDVTQSEEQRKAVDLGTGTLPNHKCGGCPVRTDSIIAHSVSTSECSAFCLRRSGAREPHADPSGHESNSHVSGRPIRRRARDDEKALCRKFKAGRSVLERYIVNPDLTLDMSEEDKEEYAIAKRNVSNTVKKMMTLMYRFRFPDIVCITTASLLISLGTRGGALTDSDSTDDDTEELEDSQYLYQVLIGGEASQIQEPALAAVSNRLPLAQQVYIGDLHQLEPHTRWHRDSPAVTYGARGVIAHPALNELLNRVAYDGELISGIHQEDRRMQLDVMRFPTPKVPFMFVDVDGSSKRARNMSHYNDTELEVCCNLVRLLTSSAIAPANICVIAFYKEQYHRAKQQLPEMGIKLSIVDAVQGREMEVVILLTTKTHFSPDLAEFSDNHKRMNVALSRCRHGQFILGHVPSLVKVPLWTLTLNIRYRGIVNYKNVQNDKMTHAFQERSEQPRCQREMPPGRATVLPDLYQVSCIEMPTQAVRLLTQLS
ncbi:hypothetical protein ANCDUO_16912 [Ancylostoma duodenale]|uniref:DNA2/NAM7 helicase-like C-terminal domain-containing protein n=1 Tax=Ancylostoma duodenale TaxID=51022 RepID=A0A0C2G255_9BILA|nr:hypothetical protein ANCDUO_16912 [Ancylostoma duodenale]